MLRDQVTKELKLGIRNRFVALKKMAKIMNWQKQVLLTDPVVVRVDSYFATRPLDRAFVQEKILCSELADTFQ